MTESSIWEENRDLQIQKSWYVTRKGTLPPPGNCLTDRGDMGYGETHCSSIFREAILGASSVILHPGCLSQTLFIPHWEEALRKAQDTPEDLSVKWTKNTLGFSQKSWRKCSGRGSLTNLENWKRENLAEEGRGDKLWNIYLESLNTRVHVQTHTHTDTILLPGLSATLCYYDSSCFLSSVWPSGIKLQFIWSPPIHPAQKKPFQSAWCKIKHIKTVETLLKRHNAQTHSGLSFFTGNAVWTRIPQREARHQNPGLICSTNDYLAFLLISVQFKTCKAIYSIMSFMGHVDLGVKRRREGTEEKGMFQGCSLVELHMAWTDEEWKSLSLIVIHQIKLSCSSALFLPKHCSKPKGKICMVTCVKTQQLYVKAEQ